MTITFPESLRLLIETRAKAAGFASVDSYILDVYLRGEAGPLTLDDDADAATDAEIAEVLACLPPPIAPKNRAELEVMLEEGMRSGPVTQATPAFWAERRRTLRAVGDAAPSGAMSIDIPARAQADIDFYAAELGERSQRVALAFLHRLDEAL